jgi:chaperonin cofactor prefoldin
LKQRRQLFGTGHPNRELKSWRPQTTILPLGGDMPVKRHSHKHPEVEQRMKTLEQKTKKLEKELRGLQRKFKTHKHPHTHPH